MSIRRLAAAGLIAAAVALAVPASSEAGHRRHCSPRVQVYSYDHDPYGYSDDRYFDDAYYDDGYYQPTRRVYRYHAPARTYYSRPYYRSRPSVSFHYHGRARCYSTHSHRSHRSHGSVYFRW